MKDFLGNDIEVGDEIVYAASLGRCAALCHAVVLEVREGTTGHTAKLLVQRIKTQYRSDWRNDADRLARKIPLQYPERCTVTKKGPGRDDCDDLPF